MGGNPGDVVTVEKEHHGREQLGSGIGFFLEMIAVIWGVYGFAIGGAIFFWLAASSYTRKTMSTWRPWAKWGTRAGMLVVITIIMCAIPLAKGYFSNKKHEHSTPIQSASTSSTQETSAKPQEVSATERTIPSKQAVRRKKPKSVAKPTIEPSQPAVSSSLFPPSSPAPVLNTPAQPTYSVTNPSGSIINQGSPNYGSQTVLNPPLNPLAPRTYYAFNGTKHVQIGNRHEASDGEFPKFQEMANLETQHNWVGLESAAEQEMAQVPEWLTPYLFDAESHAALGDRQKAIELCQQVKEKSGGNPDFSAVADKMLVALGSQ